MSDLERQIQELEAELLRERELRRKLEAELKQRELEAIASAFSEKLGRLGIADKELSLKLAQMPEEGRRAVEELLSRLQTNLFSSPALGGPNPPEIKNPGSKSIEELAKSFF